MTNRRSSWSLITAKYLLFIVLVISLAIGICGGGKIISPYPDCVSLLQLIATPDKYHNKRVIVHGVALLEFEGDSIYLTKEHYQYCVCENALWVVPDYDAIGTTRDQLARYNGKYVLMEGTFDKNNTGHLNLFSGALTHVSRYTPCEAVESRKASSRRR